MEDDEAESSPLQAKTGRQKEAKWTFWLVYTTAVCVAGSSFQFGYNMSCINAPTKVITEFFNKHGQFTTFQWAVVVSIFAIGGMLGALVGPYLASRQGRKKTLLFNNMTALLGAVLMYLSYPTRNPFPLIAGRFIIGINAGVNTTVVPMYLSEIAPIPLRGSIGTLNQFGIVLGLSCGFAFGLKEVLGTSSGWPYLLSFSIVPSVLQLLTLPCCPRSPRFLLLKLNDEVTAVYALQVLRKSTDVSDDIAEMRSEQEAQIREQSISIIEIFSQKDLRMPLLIAVVLQLSQQLSGINAVFYYSTSTFESAHISGSEYATVAVGGVSLIMTAITVKLVEVRGRRPLMLWGLAGMAVFYIVMTIAFRYEKHKGMGGLAVAATLILVIFFQLGPGPIPWFITAELFTQGPRPAACAIAATVNWLANFIVGIGFPSMKSALHPYTFLVFMVLVVLFWVFIFIFVPETKGRSVEEITSHFKTTPRNGNNYSAIENNLFETN